MNFYHLSILAISLLPISAAAQSKTTEFNIRTDAYLYKGAESLGNSDKVRWDFYKADKKGERTDDNVGGAYDATFEETIPEGSYIAVAAIGNIKREIPFTITKGKVTEINAIFDAGELTIRAKRSADNPIVEPLARIEAHGNNFQESFYGSRSFYAPAGEVKIIGTLGPARAEQTVSLKAGEKLDFDLVIPSGVVFPKATYSEGGLAVDNTAIQFQVVNADQTLDGTHESISSIFGVNKPMQLAEGKYIMRAKLGQASAEMPFEISAGKRTDVTLNINAGVLAVDAPKAERIDISAISNDLQQTEQSISARYGTEHQDTLPPGKYTVKVTYPPKLSQPDRTIETEVTASKRTELLIDLNETAPE